MLRRASLLAQERRTFVEQPDGGFVDRDGQRVAPPEHDAAATIEKVVHRRLLTCTATFERPGGGGLVPAGPGRTDHAPSTPPAPPERPSLTAAESSTVIP